MNLIVWIVEIVIMIQVMEIQWDIVVFLFLPLGVGVVDFQVMSALVYNFIRKCVVILITLFAMLLNMMKVKEN
jgi:hypothetical protein